MGEEVTLISEKGDTEFCIALPKTWKNDGTLGVLQEILDGVYFLDSDRRIQLWNRGAEQISGFHGKEVVGRCCSDNILQHLDDQGTHLCIGDCPLSAAMNTGNIKRRRYTCTTEREFVAHLLNAREKDAKAVGNRFINLIRESSVRFAKFDLRVGVSVSGTCVRPSDTVDSILRRVAPIQNSIEYDGASGMVMD
jgi:PAS domain S-box-containing protein